MKKVLIIGIDGATFEYIDPLIERGKLPNIARLIKGGVWDYLESIIQPITGPAWPSFMTGKTPAKHGIFDFVKQEIKDDVGLVNSQSIDGETIFDILSRQGKKVISINVPITYPPWKINGIMITGMLSPDNAEITYPPEFRSKLGDYQVDVKTSYSAGKEQILIDDVHTMLERRAKVTVNILKEEEWDFAAVVFKGTDVISHWFRKYMDPKHPEYKKSDARYKDAIYNIYEATDKAIGKVLGVVQKDTTVILMSDHGHGRLRKFINLNIWLLENGFLFLKKTPRVSLKFKLFKIGLTPQNVYRLLSRFGVQNLINRFSRQKRNRMLNAMLSFSDVDWNKTRVYSLGHMGQVYVNLKGREKFGIVESGAEYERVRDEFAARIKKLKDPATEEYAIERVIKKEDIYQGPHLDKAPDLFLISKDTEYGFFALMAQSTEIFSKHFKGQSGDHRLHGIFVAHGSDIERGKKITNAKIIDIAPTVLYLMGVPIPDDMDGTILGDIFRPEFTQKQKARYEKARSGSRDWIGKETDQEEIKERLRNLGYLG